MTFSSEANAKFCLDFFRRLRKDHPTENILFSPLNMSAALHLLLYGSRGDSAAEIEKMLHISDEKEDLSTESRENSEDPASHDDLEVKNYLHDENSMSTEAPEEYITDEEVNQDGTGQDVLSNPLAEECEANERPSSLDLERDARQMDRSLIPTDSQSTSDEDASASTTDRESKNPGAEDKIPPQCVLSSYGINEEMNNLVQTLEDNSSMFDSDDASSDFLPWSADYPEREDEVLSQGQTTPEDDVFDNLINSPKNKQVSFLNTSDTTNPSHSSGTEETTRLNNDQLKKLKYLGNQMNGDESGGEEGNSMQDTKKNYRQQFGIWGHNMEYSLTSAEFHIGRSFLHDLPWHKYLLGRRQREVLRQVCYQLLGNLTAPPESRMYCYMTRMKIFPFATE